MLMIPRNLDETLTDLQTRLAVVHDQLQRLVADTRLRLDDMDRRLKGKEARLFAMESKPRSKRRG